MSPDMSATAVTTKDDAARSPIASKTSFGVLQKQLFRSKETKFVLENVSQVQKWSKFSQRWLFHAPREPVGYYTNSKIDTVVANLSYSTCVLAMFSVLLGCAVDDYRRRQKQANIDIHLSGEHATAALMDSLTRLFADITWDNLALACVSCSNAPHHPISFVCMLLFLIHRRRHSHHGFAQYVQEVLQRTGDQSVSASDQKQTV
jgi:hypothetical protein